MHIRIAVGLCFLLMVTCIDIIVPKAPPKPYQAALMARYIIHQSGWTSVATISSMDKIKGYPFVGLKSLSDGMKQNSTGNTYMYMTSMDVSGHDIESDPRVTLMTSLAETSYCETEDFDPQDPRCSKVMITGSLMKIPKHREEYQFGEAALFDKHPSMKDWPKDHDFYVAKVKMEQILVLDYFGGIKHVSIKDYFNQTITNIINQDGDLSGVTIIEIVPR